MYLRIGRSESSGLTSPNSDLKGAPNLCSAVGELSSVISNLTCWDRSSRLRSACCQLPSPFLGFTRRTMLLLPCQSLSMATPSIVQLLRRHWSSILSHVYSEPCVSFLLYTRRSRNSISIVDTGKESQPLNPTVPAISPDLTVACVLANGVAPLAGYIADNGRSAVQTAMKHCFSSARVQRRGLRVFKDRVTR